MLLLNFREREREREREEDSLFNAVPLLHILVSTTSLTLSHTTKSAMALPIGKVVVILGAGIVGSVLAKEGRMSTVSDFVSGAFKMSIHLIIIFQYIIDI